MGESKGEGEVSEPSVSIRATLSSVLGTATPMDPPRRASSGTIVPSGESSDIPHAWLGLGLGLGFGLGFLGLGLGLGVGLLGLGLGFLG